LNHFEVMPANVAYLFSAGGAVSPHKETHIVTYPA